MISNSVFELHESSCAKQLKKQEEERQIKEERRRVEEERRRVEEEMRRVEEERRRVEEESLRMIEEEEKIQREIEEMQMREYQEFESAINRAPSINREIEEIKCPECLKKLDPIELDDHLCRCKHCFGDYPSFLLNQHYQICPTNLRERQKRAGKLTDEQIKQLPEIRFCPGKGSDIKCMVCLEEFQSGERLKLLTCFHGFHHDCISHWLSLKGLCPVCKLPIDL